MRGCAKMATAPALLWAAAGGEGGYLMSGRGRMFVQQGVQKKGRVYVSVGGE